MSLKKTWFSYVLWALSAGLTLLISYVAVIEVFAMHPIVLGGMVLLPVGVCLLLHWTAAKLLPFAASKVMVRVGALCMTLAVIGIFVSLRYFFSPSFGEALHADETQQFFHLSMIGAQKVPVEGLTGLEDVYSKCLSVLFLFFGNKAEVILYFQIALQSLTLFSLFGIGRRFYRGMYAFVLPLLYAASPFAVQMLTHAGIVNFYLCITVLLLALLCLSLRKQKQQKCLYIAAVVLQLGILALLFFGKRNVLLYGGAVFSFAGEAPTAFAFLEVELLLVLGAMFFYFTAFFLQKQDMKSFFLLPLMGALLLGIWMFLYEAQTGFLLLSFAAIQIYLLFAEGLCSCLTVLAKQSVNMQESLPMEDAIVIQKMEENIEQTKTEQRNPEQQKEKQGKTELLKEEQQKAKVTLQKTEIEEDPGDGFDWVEMQKLLKESSAMEKKRRKMKKNETVQEQEEAKEAVFDKRAPIENVLPMPKKHVKKKLDYAFEPKQEQMHFDVEIENDDYDI